MSLFIRCGHSKCKTGLPGIITPIAAFKATKAPPYMPEGHAVLQDMKLCESCALTANIHTLIDNKRWAEISRQITAAGGAEPDRKTLRMVLGAPKDQPLPQMFREALKRERKAQ